MPFSKGNQLAKGHRHSDEVKRRIGVAAALRAGEKSSRWKGGKSKLYELKMLKMQCHWSKPLHCDVCGMSDADSFRGLCFDHDHVTGVFRGWLCGRCNLVLGHVKDDPILLENLIKYLTV